MQKAANRLATMMKYIVDDEIFDHPLSARLQFVEVHVIPFLEKIISDPSTRPYWLPGWFDVPERLKKLQVWCLNRRNALLTTALETENGVKPPLRRNRDSFALLAIQDAPPHPPTPVLSETVSSLIPSPAIASSLTSLPSSLSLSTSLSLSLVSSVPSISLDTSVNHTSAMSLQLVDQPSSSNSSVTNSNISNSKTSGNDHTGSNSPSNDNTIQSTQNIFARLQKEEIKDKEKDGVEKEQVEKDEEKDEDEEVDFEHQKKNHGNSKNNHDGMVKQSPPSVATILTPTPLESENSSANTKSPHSLFHFEETPLNEEQVIL